MRRWIDRALTCGLLLALAGVLSRPLVAEQMDEEEVARALDRLGQLLGLPPVSAEELTTKVEEIGGLSFRHQVPVDFMSREDLGDYIGRLFEEEYPASFARREERMLRAFGFLEEGRDLRAIRERVLNENIAGFYDERPGVKKLFAISSGTSLNVMNQMILAHELRHAVQDQHVEIREQLEVESDFDDRRLAALCLIEGDAMILMSQYLTSSMTNAVPGMGDLLAAMGALDESSLAQMYALGPALGEAPAVVQEQLMAPYLSGVRIASVIFERDGFDGLNEALREPPRSMEQVLHPEKYLDERDEPVEVTLTLGYGRTPDFEGRLGELLVRVLLDGELDRPRAEKAAAGWGGDHYLVVPEGAAYRLLWKTIWDTKQDASEFEDAIEHYASRRFPGGDYRLERSGKEVSLERWGFQ